ncbi:MAG: hypothetical protein RR086_05005, partial [Clostridia bacterium]
MKNKLNLILSCAIFGILLLLVINPQKYMLSILNGLSLWATSVLPALFPFLIFTKLLTNLGVAQKVSSKITIIQKLFNAPEGASYVYAMSLICGYPIGAKVIAEGYESKIYDTYDCYKLATFCSSASPIFILGTIAGALLKNTLSGVIIFACHLLSTLIVGLIFRNCYNKQSSSNKIISIKKESINETMLGSILSVLSVGGFIAIFSLIIDVVKDILPIFNSTNPIFAFMLGLLEMTVGCKMIAETTNIVIATTLICALVSFGGICVLLQNMIYYQKCKIKVLPIIAFKTTQSAISIL